MRAVWVQQQVHPRDSFEESRHSPHRWSSLQLSCWLVRDSVGSSRNFLFVKRGLGDERLRNVARRPQTDVTGTRHIRHSREMLKVLSTLAPAMGEAMRESTRSRRGRTLGLFLVGIAVGTLVLLGTLTALGFSITSAPSPGVAKINAIWVNYTYATPPPANDSQPLSEVYQGSISGGSPGSQFTITMSPYDTSAVNCTLWSLTVLAPFELVSVTVTGLPLGGQVHEPLPVTLPAAVHGTSYLANLSVVLVLPGHPSSYTLSMSGTATCA